MLDLPIAFKKTIVDLYDERGQEWLQALPATISAFEERWSIRVLPHFKGLSYNFVAPVVCSDGTEAVLKLGVPNRELATEYEALRLYNGQGMVQLFAADIEHGALLIERIRPGQCCVKWKTIRWRLRSLPVFCSSCGARCQLAIRSRI
jgi:streptomycin 6-kinase